MGGKSRTHRDSIPDRPARGQSLDRLRVPGRHEKELDIGTKLNSCLKLASIINNKQENWKENQNKCKQ